MYSMNEIDTCRIVVNDKSELIYRYFITEEEKSFNNSNVKIRCYGICAESEKLYDNKQIPTYKDTIECISPYKEKVLEIIDFLKENEVSPIHLVEVIGDKVDSMTGDFDIKEKNECACEEMA